MNYLASWYFLLCLWNGDNGGCLPYRVVGVFKKMQGRAWTRAMFRVSSTADACSLEQALLRFVRSCFLKQVVSVYLDLLSKSTVGSAT
jgi:hypothetical protein